MLSGLSHHYSRHKALVSLKPLLDFLSPTSAYQRPSHSPFSAQARGGGEPTDVWRPETKLPRSLAAQRSGPGAPNSGASVPSPVPEHNTRNESDRSPARPPALPHGLAVRAQERHTWSGPLTKWLALRLRRSPLPLLPASESCAPPHQEWPSLSHDPPNSRQGLGPAATDPTRVQDAPSS